MVNPEKYTQKSVEALREAQNLTLQNGNQQMEQIHLFSALLRQEDGLTALSMRASSRCSTETYSSRMSAAMRSASVSA